MDVAGNLRPGGFGLGYQVEGGACLVPADLVFVVGVVGLDLVFGSVGVVEDQGERHAGGEVVEAEDVDGVVLLNLVLVGGVGEGEGEHSLSRREAVYWTLNYPQLHQFTFATARPSQRFP